MSVWAKTEDSKIQAMVNQLQMVLLGNSMATGGAALQFTLAITVAEGAVSIDHALRSVDLLAEDMKRQIPMIWDQVQKAKGGAGPASRA
jgi:hypothetical protein